MPCHESGGLLLFSQWSFAQMVETELKRHESRIMVNFIEHFRLGDVVLTDRGFSSYGNLAALWIKGVDAVMRVHQARKLDYRKGKVLGPMDRLVEWAWKCYAAKHRKWCARNCACSSLLIV
ncbi:transposase [Coraliomargarita sp. SDUM461004]|uniref:Transposase n=1 Tax=Thalassobacterium sedimentorum TaxID=3041258 RepID=A0ABU1ANE2_9BACT|nr:transposase [Coraliomargarita sp. SDUM461004]MDQ8196237.1 transposase [Coraliomargarita sp. SDUM461004]